LTNGGGPGIIAADASARNNLILPTFSPETVSKLKSVIKRDIVINNPLDTTAGATAEEFRYFTGIGGGAGYRFGDGDFYPADCFE